MPDLIIPADSDDREECPVCGAQDLALWAEDGVAPRADFYECQPCKATGRVLYADDARATWEDLDEAARAPWADLDEFAAEWLRRDDARPTGPTGPTGAPGPTGPTGQRRTVLVHLNVDVPGWDERSAGEIAGILMQALYVGLEGAPEELDVPDPGMVELAMAEDV